MKIVIVSACYSEGMGYSENCLSRALAKLGHDVHLVTSTYNVYGNEPLYDVTYRNFLGSPQTTPGMRIIDGYTLHRLDAGLLSGYVNIRGLTSKVRELAPDIVHSLEVASLQTYKLACLKPVARFKLFTETHQTLSVMRPYMLHKNGEHFKRAAYRLTRTLPSFLSSLTIEACYGVTPDCCEVARRFYGVPASKLKLLSLGAEPDALQAGGFTPLAAAAFHGNREIVKMLLDHHADPNIREQGGYTPLHAAAKNGADRFERRASYRRELPRRSCRATPG